MATSFIFFISPATTLPFTKIAPFVVTSTDDQDASPNQSFVASPNQPNASPNRRRKEIIWNPNRLVTALDSSPLLVISDLGHSIRIRGLVIIRLEVLRANGEGKTWAHTSALLKHTSSRKMVGMKGSVSFGRSPRGEAGNKVDDWAFEEGPHSDFTGTTYGCTSCVAIMRNNQLIVANAGDYRYVISRKGEFVEAQEFTCVAAADPTCDDSELPPSAAAAADPTCVLFSAYQSHPKVQLNIP
ncbi:hypothetical protein SSX86_001812 [Deinandra increscens subsp. villosa]|uniref:PPM-type phosphatase domain-containing protein n=1 Tax=Deinandra increscens subsp. villosa TaxID=3103831 RepID=A0AAP0DW39_9ASTR